MKLLVLIGLFIIGWELFWYLGGVKPVFAWQLKKWIRSAKHEVRLIDVRTPFEFNWFHIDGSESRPEMAFMTKNFEEENREKRIVIICMTGHRSPIVAHRLKKQGYENVYNLVWGMWAWKLFGGKTK
jgi:rhodanese-related sulfurtransferase